MWRRSTGRSQHRRSTRGPPEIAEPVVRRARHRGAGVAPTGTSRVFGVVLCCGDSARNHGCRSEVWFGTKSRMDAQAEGPSPSAISASESSAQPLPKRGSTIAIVGHVRSQSRPSGDGKNGEIPDRVDAQRGEVAEPAGGCPSGRRCHRHRHPGNERGVDLIDHPVSPPSIGRGNLVGQLRACAPPGGKRNVSAGQQTHDQRPLVQETRSSIACRWASFMTATANGVGDFQGLARPGSIICKGAGRQPRSG